MKAINLTTGLVLIMLLSACSSTRLSGPGVYYDDIYYVPGATSENMNQVFSPVPAISKEAQKAEKQNLTQQQKEYQNSEKSQNLQDERDFSAIQEEYATILSDENIQEADTLIYYNDETGYWVNGFDGTSNDRDYAERMIRFHGPYIRIPYYSPLYSEIVYFNNYDYNVYVDGSYAYAIPTWTNRWYSSYYFGGSWGSPYWGFGTSWGYPYYNNYWGMDYGWYNPYGYHHYPPYYSHYYNPYYSPYHHGGGYYGGGNSNSSDRTYYSGMRSGMSSGTRATSGTRLNSREILKSSSGERSRTANSGTRISRDQQGNTRYENEDGTVYTRTTRGGAAQQTLKSTNGETTQGTVRTTTRGGQVGNTRKSYTPSYSKPEDNSRPTYNRATYTRVTGDARSTQSTGTVQSTNTGTRQIQNNTNSRVSTVTPRTSTTSGNSSSPMVSSPNTQSRTSTTGGTRTVAPSTTRPRAATNYQQGSTNTRPSSGSNMRPASGASSSDSYQRSSGMGSSSSSSSSYNSGGSSSGSSSSGNSRPSSSSSSSNSGGSRVHQSRR
jgi:hypothetical protein